MRERFTRVTLNAKANIHCDGRCVSYTFFTADGARKSAGVILPSLLTLSTERPEIMELLAGNCRVRIARETDWSDYHAGETFSIPSRSQYEIEVTGEPLQYVCHYVN